MKQKLKVAIDMPCHIGAQFLYTTLSEADKMQKALPEIHILFSN